MTDKADNPAPETQEAFAKIKDLAMCAPRGDEGKYLTQIIRIATEAGQIATADQLPSAPLGPEARENRAPPSANPQNEHTNRDVFGKTAFANTAPEPLVAPGSFGIEDSRIAYQRDHAQQSPPPETPSQDDNFLHRLVENAFSWGKQDCNYLNPKHIDRFIESTRNGMPSEAAAAWIADGSVVSQRSKVTVSYAHCCSGPVRYCDCVNKNHGTALMSRSEAGDDYEIVADPAPKTQMRGTDPVDGEQKGRE